MLNSKGMAPSRTYLDLRIDQERRKAGRNSNREEAQRKGQGEGETM
jgi:hypothetical protein